MIQNSNTLTICFLFLVFVAVRFWNRYFVLTGLTPKEMRRICKEEPSREKEFRTIIRTAFGLALCCTLAVLYILFSLFVQFLEVSGGAF